MEKLSDEFAAQRESSRIYDRRLEMLMDIILGDDDEHSGNGFGVSLISNGAKINGTVSTYSEWTAGQTQAMRSTEQAGPIWLADVLEKIEESLDAIKSDIPEHLKTRRYINLVNATVHVGGTENHYPYLRVLIDRVDAWSFA